jgi:hypothetical protein
MDNRTKQAIRVALKYRQDEQEQGGIVLVWAGQVYGWKNALRDPQHERPGVMAVDADGVVWLAVGGNDQDGAKAWEKAQQENEPEGCIRARLKPGQELPEPPSEQELQQAIREGRIAAVINGKRVEPQQP